MESEVTEQVHTFLCSADDGSFSAKLAKVYRDFFMSSLVLFGDKSTGGM
jgi:hypothetical protein